MDGTEPFLQDQGLLPVVTYDRDPNQYLYRRNSCHQERLQHDLKRLEQQEERSLRRTNREIIDLHLEQKGRKEILNHSRARRRSECLGIQGAREQQHGVLLHGSAMTSDERRASTGRIWASRPKSHDSAIQINDAVPRLAGKANDGKRRRATCVVTTTTTTTKNATRPTAVSPSNSTSASSSASERRILDRQRSRSHDLTSVEAPPSAPVTSQSSAASSSADLHERYMDARSLKEFSRLKKASDRWRDAVRAAKSGGGGVIERTGKPPIPTSCFAASSSASSSDTGVQKTSDVFDRLSLETRTSAMPSDKFFQLMRSKTKQLVHADSPRKPLKSASDI